MLEVTYLSYQSGVQMWEEAVTTSERNHSGNLGVKKMLDLPRLLQLEETQTRVHGNRR